MHCLRCLTRLVKSVGKGPWVILEAMKHDRPMDRFWLGALSGIILNANPSDIAGPMSMIGSEAWGNKDHVYHAFSGPKEFEC